MVNQINVYRLPCSVCGQIIDKRVVCGNKCQGILLNNSRKKKGKTPETIVEINAHIKSQETTNPSTSDSTIPSVLSSEEIKINLCEHGNPIGSCEFGCL